MNSHTYSFKSKFQALLPAIALTLVIAPSAQAGLTDLTSVIPVGQTVVFSDDFNNNDNGWTNVAPSGTGVATIGTDPLSGSESALYPTATGSIEFKTQVTIPTPVDINANSFSFYYRTRIEADDLGTRFSGGAREKENPANLSYLNIWPTSNSQIYYRDTSAAVITDLGGTDLITVADAYENFRFDYIKTGEGVMSLTGYHYNEDTTTWDQFNSVTDARFSTTGTNAGLFDYFELSSRNAGANNRAVFDAFAVTTIPEPSSLILLGMSFGLLALFRKKGQVRS